jgi:hypothetical protein
MVWKAFSCSLEMLFCDELLVALDISSIMMRVEFLTFIRYIWRSACDYWGCDKELVKQFFDAVYMCLLDEPVINRDYC